MDSLFTVVLDQIIHNYIAYLAVMARIFGAMNVFPIMSGSYFGRMIKLCMAMAFSIVVFPTINTGKIEAMGPIIIMILIAKEYFVGYIIGYVTSVPIWVIENVGQFIDRQRGETLGGSLSNLTNTQDSSIGKLLLQAFTVYFVSMNGVLFFLSFLYQSYQVFPAEAFLPVVSKAMMANYVSIFENLMVWSIVLSMPIVIVMFFVEVIMGIISAFLPQLNVTVLSMPIKSAIGIFVLAIYIGNLFHFVLLNYLDKTGGFHG